MDEFSIMGRQGEAQHGEDSDAESFASAQDAEGEEGSCAHSVKAAGSPAQDRKDPVGITQQARTATASQPDAADGGSSGAVTPTEGQAGSTAGDTHEIAATAGSSQDAAGACRQAADEEQAGGVGCEPVQPQLSPEEQQVMLDKAEAFKAEGNTLYAQGQYEEAVAKYAQAVDAAPPAPYAKHERAVYLANMAAAEIGLKHWAEAASAASDALDEEPGYVKALMRRAMALEQLDQLEQALVDVKKILELDAHNTWASAALRRIEPVVAERHEKLKNEMLGKMKELGNMVLGKFGMSVDNFKAVKDPATGSYSISFQQ